VFNILLIEDNLIFRRSFKDFLTNRFPDVAINETGDGAEALKSVEAAPPDLIFMDINLPGTNGIALSRMIKKEHPRIPIIILTLYDLSEFQDAIRQYGADYFITKSTMNGQKIEDLVETIRSNKPDALHGPTIQHSTVNRVK